MGVGELRRRQLQGSLIGTSDEVQVLFLPLVQLRSQKWKGPCPGTSSNPHALPMPWIFLAYSSVAPLPSMQSETETFAAWVSPERSQQDSISTWARVLAMQALLAQALLCAKLWV